MVVEALHNAAVVLGGVEAFVGEPEIGRRNGFESHEQTAATAATAEFEELGVVGEEDGGEAIPLHAQRNEGAEEFERVAAMGDEIEVDEDEFMRAVLADIGDDLGDRFLERFFAPRDGDDAEVTAVHATARGFEDVIGEKMFAREKIAARERAAADSKIRSLVVAWPHGAGRKVAEELGPRIFGVADDDRVGVRCGVGGNEGDMRAAEDDGDTAAAEVVGEFVGADGRARDDREADEIGIQIKRDVGDALVKQLRVCRHIGRNQGGQRGERERLIAQRFFPDAAAMPVEWALGGNQRNFEAPGRSRAFLRREHSGLDM